MSKKIVWNTRYKDAEINDYYATDPIALEELLKYETFSHEIWEPACGEGHLSKVLINHGYDVYSSDLVYRGFGDPESFNFLEESLDDFNGDIITNPPYSILDEVLEHSFEIADNIVYLVPLSKIVSSMKRIRKISSYGGVPLIYILSASKCNFPFGFPACAIHIKRNYNGITKIIVDKNINTIDNSNYSIDDYLSEVI